jgi:aromatic ring-cleaving dioxygenase
MTDPAAIRGYHAHVYYDRSSRPVAARLRTRIERRFKVRMGRWHDDPIGPHPKAMYQVAFGRAEFPRIVPWLMLNRAGLRILVHPETGDDYTDHAERALWLGGRMRLRLAILRRFASRR